LFGSIPTFYRAYRRVVDPRLAPASATEQESVLRVLALGPIGAPTQLFSNITSLEIGYDSPQLDKALTGALVVLDQLRSLTWRVDGLSRRRIVSIGRVLTDALVRFQHRRPIVHSLSELILIVSEYIIGLTIILSLSTGRIERHQSPGFPVTWLAANYNGHMCLGGSDFGKTHPSSHSRPIPLRLS
jgi:hypothetical protein